MVKIIVLSIRRKQTWLASKFDFFLLQIKENGILLILDISHISQIFIQCLIE